MGQANEPKMKELTNGRDKVLYAVNSAFIKQYNEDLAIAIKEQSSYNEVTAVEYKETANLIIQNAVCKIFNGLVMHSCIAPTLDDNKRLEKLMRLMPLKAVAIFEANAEYIAQYDLVKEGTPLVTNTKSGYAPSIYYKSNVLVSDKTAPQKMDRDTAIALQVLDVHSDEMFRDFGIEMGKILKGVFASLDHNLISIEYSLGIDSTNNMRLADISLEVKKDDKVLSMIELAKLLAN